MSHIRDCNREAVRGRRCGARRFSRMILPVLAVPLLALGEPEDITGHRDDASRVHAEGTRTTLKRDAALDLRELEPASDEPYRLGAGDEITIEVSGRSELTGRHVLGPDGRITIAVAGALTLAGHTRDGAAAAIAKVLGTYYSDPKVTVRVDRYSSNRILLLGRVSQPGVLHFDRPPTLIEVLTRGGPAPAVEGAAQAMPARCAVFRGRDKVFWIDLRRLLEEAGGMADIRLRADDVVYVPADQEEYVSVLGEVNHPGAVLLRRDTTLADVLARAGGLSEAAAKKVRMISATTGDVREISMNDVLDPSKASEVSLRNGDIVYVPARNLSRIGYVLRQLGPAGTLLMFGALLGGE